MKYIKTKCFAGREEVVFGMKDIVIISIYDSAIGLSVLLDGKVYETHDRFERANGGEENVADEIDDIFAKAAWESERCKNAFKEKFPNKQVILCEDGGIEIL